jgi:hypothetical protein
MRDFFSRIVDDSMGGGARRLIAVIGRGVGSSFAAAFKDKISSCCTIRDAHSCEDGSYKTHQSKKYQHSYLQGFNLCLQSLNLLLQSTLIGEDTIT